MIITHGDVLSTDVKIIAHQVNCKGVMGGGLAAQIKEKYPKVFLAYKEYIEDFAEIEGASPLGNCLSCWKDRSEDTEIWNIFGQDDYGRDKCYTNYFAVSEAFRDAIDQYRSCRYGDRDIQLPIAIPCYFGCGLGGGDWSKMKEVLEKIEKDCNVIFIAYKYS